LIQREIKWFTIRKNKANKYTDKELWIERMRYDRIMFKQSQGGKWKIGKVVLIGTDPIDDELYFHTKMQESAEACTTAKNPLIFNLMNEFHLKPPIYPSDHFGILAEFNRY